MLFEPAAAAPFPIRLEVDYPERLSRLSTLFRLILAIPVLIVLGLLGQGLIWVYWIGILMRGRPVRWLFDVNVAVLRFTLRAYAYLLLLTDRYPPFDGEWQVRFEVDYPQRLSRWRLVIWKTATVLPHFIVLGFVFVGVVVVVILAWFAVLFTGRYPRGLHSFVSGWLRWTARASAYWISLTDEFPSFSLAADAGPAYFSSYVISAIFGWLIVLAWGGGITAVIVWPGQSDEVTVSYQRLLEGEPSGAVEVSEVAVMLLDADDPYTVSRGVYQPQQGNRFVLFHLLVQNYRSGPGDLGVRVEENDFGLKDSLGGGHDPVLVTVGGRKPPLTVNKGGLGEVWMMFEVNEDALPAEVKYSPNFGFKQRIKFVLE
jgi:hypothetical protein